MLIKDSQIEATFLSSRYSVLNNWNIETEHQAACRRESLSISMTNLLLGRTNEKPIPYPWPSCKIRV